MLRIRQACETAGVKPRRVVLRSYALASLMKRIGNVPEQTVMLVDRIGEEVDLVVLVDGRSTFQRTFRVPSGGDEAKTLNRLVTEISRTAAVAFDDPAARPIECVYVLGRADEQEPLAERIRSETGLAAKIFDPLEAMGIADRAAAEQPQRFAPLVGHATGRGASARPTCWISSIRGGPGPAPARRRAFLLGGMAAAVAILLAANAVWETLGEAEARIKPWNWNSASSRTKSRSSPSGASSSTACTTGSTATSTGSMNSATCRSASPRPAT